MLLSQQTTNDLTATIKTLTVVRVVLTIFIALLTVVMAWPTIAAWYAKEGGWMTAGVLPLIGLIFGIAGTAVLVWGVVVRHMTTFRIMEVDASQPWHRRLSLYIARRFGSRDVTRTTPDLLGEYSSALWGLFLLGLGFVFQALGQLCSMRGNP